MISTVFLVIITLIECYHTYALSDISSIGFICYPDTVANVDNNYCLRDDIVVTSTDNQLHISSSGCPDHGIPAACNISQQYGMCPDVPRYQKYQMSIPKNPTIDKSGPFPVPLQGVYDGSGDFENGPVGIAANGVLLYSEYVRYGPEGEFKLSSSSLDLDSCGGFTDIANRYHYRASPLCLLDRMRSTVPASPSDYIAASNKDIQISHWPVTGTPSPIVGYALDGFPIYGPYNSTGQLQVAGEGGALDDCNFDSRTQRYYITANAPFVPACLVGELGSFQSTVIPQGLCPSKGVDSVWCNGPGCQPKHHAVNSTVEPFRADIKWFLTLSITCVLLFILVGSTYRRIFYPELFHYPAEKIVNSMLPAFLLLLVLQPLYKVYFGDSSAAEDYTINYSPISTYLNEAIGSFLTVSGVLYSLIVSQLFSLINEKFKNIRDALGDELASCRQIVLCIKAIQLPTSSDAKVTPRNDKQVLQKMKAVKVVVWYVSQLAKKWGQSVGTNDDSLDVLYGLLPLVSTLCDDTNTQFNYHVADRIMDSLNELANAKYHRLALEDQSVPTAMWYLQYLLSTVMFLGVVFIFTGSELLDYTICYLSAMLVGMVALIIADMDMPYNGLIRIQHDPVYELLSTLAASDDKAALATNLDRKNSRFFKSDLGRVSSGTLSKAVAASNRRSFYDSAKLATLGSERRSSLKGVARLVSLSGIRTPKVFSRNNSMDTTATVGGTAPSMENNTWSPGTSRNNSVMMSTALGDQNHDVLPMSSGGVIDESSSENVIQGAIVQLSLQKRQQYRDEASRIASKYNRDESFSDESVPPDMESGDT
mmetsp:Transcript_9047/g.13595  ORF Transcript_9047/g.13595 Transcript_9047/m.13595 type:complete len:820 (+) Transcript_9047:212-2671(+)|eukprot:CAMPEP_0185030524 /NCGR_PEP_ID=MMETSP1103-20130426/17521_1 /TAXON_ID=36769 /ORGANISM="Paraphysomonas bandaiensis, Strain Caron Lab Isolate" /LENGTH=819 /DNA_ID=CAMNT_0027565697 /DNA_START=102 /DNA_END=2561 /DNA_ORIENTATION=-